MKKSKYIEDVNNKSLEDAVIYYEENYNNYISLNYYSFLSVSENLDSAKWNMLCAIHYRIKKMKKDYCE